MKRLKPFIIICIILLMGCGEEASPTKISAQGELSQQKANVAKQIILSMDEVEEVKGVVVDQDVYLAPKVKHFSRFWLEEIRKKSRHKVAKRFPNMNVHLSTDKKVYIELEKLEKMIQKREISKKELLKKVFPIEQMIKEQEGVDV